MISLKKKMANTLRNCTIILICIASNLYLAKAQSIEANLELYANKYSPERIYIHYDKSAYSVGETIWFKVYMINEVVPADESKTLYIDWIDDKGNLVLHAVNPMVEGITAGQFENWVRPEHMTGAGKQN